MRTTGDPFGVPRPSIVNGFPLSVITSTARGGTKSSAGFGAGNRPGQGRSASRNSDGAGSPKGTSRTRSCGPRPPTRNARCTPSGPSIPCTRASTRSTRSTSLDDRPHMGTSRAVLGRTSSATSVIRSIPRGISLSLAPTVCGDDTQVSSCQRRRSKMSGALQGPS